MRFLLTFVFLYGAIVLFANEDLKKYQTAHTYYSDGSYDKAMDIYLELAENGYASPELFKNTAACYTKMKNYGHAVLYYEKALKLQPNNQDIKQDLSIVQSKIPGFQEEIPPFILVKIWKYIAGMLSETYWTFLSIFFSVFIVAGFYFYLNPIQKLSHSFIKRSLLVLVLVFTGSLLMGITRKNMLQNEQTYIVTTSGGMLKNGPDDLSPEVMSLPEGSKLFEQDRIGEWLQVRTVNAELGWVKIQSIQKI